MRRAIFYIAHTVERSYGRRFNREGNIIPGSYRPNSVVRARNSVSFDRNLFGSFIVTLIRPNYLPVLISRCTGLYLHTITIERECVQFPRLLERFATKSVRHFITYIYSHKSSFAHHNHSLWHVVSQALFQSLVRSYDIYLYPRPIPCVVSAKADFKGGTQTE